MDDGGELEDWIKELSETKERLGRLSVQLQSIEPKQDFHGMIGRIMHLQRRLDAIRNWLERQKPK